MLCSVVYADGICSLDKYNYSPGEASTFLCSCTSPGEENRAGYIVWKNSTGDILKSTAVNSGSCVSSVFGAQHVFSTENNNYTGNVTFSLNADGTGEPLNWDDIDDNITDTFIVNGSSSIDCIITINNLDEDEIPYSNIGEMSTIYFTVTDGITGYSLTHAQCSGFIINPMTNQLYFQEPYSGSLEKYHMPTQGFGLGYLEHFFDETTYTTNTVYDAKITCYCINGTDEACYLGNGGNGIDAGYKECQTEFLFQLRDDNSYKYRDIPMLPIILSSMMLICLYSFLGFINYRYKIMNFDSYSHYIYFFCFGLSLIQMIYMLGILYGHYMNYSLALLIQINFISNLILLFGIGVFTITYSFVTLLSEEYEKKDDDSEKKWEK